MSEIEYLQSYIKSGLARVELYYRPKTCRREVPENIIKYEKSDPGIAEKKVFPNCTSPKSNLAEHLCFSDSCQSCAALFEGCYILR